MYKVCFTTIVLKWLHHYSLLHTIGKVLRSVCKCRTHNNRKSSLHTCLNHRLYKTDTAQYKNYNDPHHCDNIAGPYSNVFAHVPNRPYFSHLFLINVEDFKIEKYMNWTEYLTSQPKQKKNQVRTLILLPTYPHFQKHVTRIKYLFLKALWKSEV